MTEQQIQDAISALYEVTADTPATSDDDYLTRRRLMNRALHAWERNKGFWWDSLWATDTSKTILASTQIYAAPANFRRPAGFVELYSGTNMVFRYDVVKPNDARVLGQYESYAYFTGSPATGYFLNLSPAVTTSMVGYTIKYDYYKTATEYTDPTTISEITNPEYIIHSVCAELWKGDRKMSAYQTSLAEAQEALKGMEVAHVANIDWQSNDLSDQSEGFGY